MKKQLLAALAGLFSRCGTAQAEGCLKGAAVGMSLALP